MNSFWCWGRIWSTALNFILLPEFYTKIHSKRKKIFRKQIDCCPRENFPWFGCCPFQAIQCLPILRYVLEIVVIFLLLFHFCSGSTWRIIICISIDGEKQTNRTMNIFSNIPISRRCNVVCCVFELFTLCKINLWTFHMHSGVWEFPVSLEMMFDTRCIFCTFLFSIIFFHFQAIFHGLCSPYATHMANRSSCRCHYKNENANNEIYRLYKCCARVVPAFFHLKHLTHFYSVRSESKKNESKRSNKERVGVRCENFPTLPTKYLRILVPISTEDLKSVRNNFRSIKY